MMRSCLAAALAAILLSATGATTPASARAADKPTVVLVHGAFADASGFGAVTGRLQDRGYTVISPRQPAPRPGERCRLRGERHAHHQRSDRARRTLLRRRCDLRSRHPGHERQGAGLPRRARAGGGREQPRHPRALPQQALPGTADPSVPAGRRQRGNRSLHRPGAVPVGLRRRPPRKDHYADGHRPASRIAGRRRGEVHRAGLEDDPLLVPGRAPGPDLHR